MNEVELMNDKAEKIVEGKSINSPQRRGWLLGIAGILLLVCVQPLLSAKTLLEQYLNCDGFEEFAFYLSIRDRQINFPAHIGAGVIRMKIFC